jgi:hypothetical protein
MLYYECLKAWFSGFEVLDICGGFLGKITAPQVSNIWKVYTRPTSASDFFLEFYIELRKNYILGAVPLLFKYFSRRLIHVKWVKYIFEKQFAKQPLFVLSIKMRFCSNNEWRWFLMLPKWSKT